VGVAADDFSELKRDEADCSYSRPRKLLLLNSNIGNSIECGFALSANSN